MSKFDCVIGNPPYQNGLHLKFLDKAIEISEGIVAFIQPAQFLLNEKPTKRKQIEIKLYTSIEKHGAYIKIFNGNSYFDASFFIPLGIIIFDKNNYSNIIVEDSINKMNYIPKDITEISKYGNDKVYFSLKNKILKFSEKYNLYKFKNKNSLNFYINLAGIRGHIDKFKMYQDDFYTFIPKTETIENQVNKMIYFSFETEVEAQNFLDYLKTDFARFALSIYKNGANLHRLELASVPYLDFKESWPKEKLYEYFNLTNEEINFIETNIPKYYND